MTTTSIPPSGAEKGRLLRRVQLVARLRHPNLVRMLPLPGGAGLAPVLNDARRLADFTLPAGTFKRFDLEQVVRLLLDVLSGLSALHEVESDGVAFVHGEAAPQNIYVDEHGTARLVPLMSSHLIGTKPEPTGYVAPERLLGADVDARADVFSVGAMLWEALSGQRLFPDPTPNGVLARLAGGKPPPLHLTPRLAWAKPLCAIAERAICADPNRRFASAVDLSNAIAAATAQQLSKVDTDAWQEEAPTPVFQPNLHLATFRTSTPGPQVISISQLAVARVAPLPPALPVMEEPTLVMGAKEEPTGVMSARPSEPLEPEEALELVPPLETWQRGRRGRGALLGAAAVLLMAVGVAAPRASGWLKQLELPSEPALMWLGSETAPTHAAAPALPAPRALSASAPLAPPAASAALSSSSHGGPTSAPLPPASAKPSSGPASKAPPGKSPATPHVARPKSKSGESGADYGI